MSEGVEVIVARLERKLNENPNTVWLLFGADALRAKVARQFGISRSRVAQIVYKAQARKKC
jgi:hypothetical protein